MFQKHYFPDFMIIGAQKSGTSTLHFLLDQHPALVGSHPKEIHYFDKPPEERKSLEWYKSHFSKSFFERRKLFFDATPNYIYHIHIPAELFALNPLMKFIIMLRNPVARCFSAWNMYKDIFDQYKKGMPLGVRKDGPIFQYFFKGRINFPTLEKCLDIELDLMKLNPQIVEPALLRRGLYYGQLVNYFKVFPVNKLFIIESDNFRSNMYDCLDSMANFLGVSPFNRSSLDIQNKHVRKYDEKMLESTRLFLNEFYREPNEKLYNLLGVQFNW